MVGPDPGDAWTDIRAELSHPATALSLVAAHWDDLSEVGRRDLVDAARSRLEGVLAVLGRHESRAAASPAAVVAAPVRLLDVVAAVLPQLPEREVVVHLAAVGNASVALPRDMTQALVATVIANVIGHSDPPLRIDVRAGARSVALQLIGQLDPATTRQPLIEPLADPRATDDQARARRLGRLLRDVLADRHGVSVTVDDASGMDRLSVTLRLPAPRQP